MSNAKSSNQTEVLAIRMTPQLLKQLNILAQAKNIGTATMARMALTEYLKEQAPDALLSTTQPQTFNKPKPTINKPSQQVDWNDPDQVRQAKAIHQHQEAQRKAKTEAYLEALRSGEIPPEEDDPWA